jgi:hypothetical protein
MNKTKLLCGSSSDSWLRRARWSGPHFLFVRPKGVCTLCTPLCTCGLHFDSVLVVLPSPLHAGLCCRRHDFAARVHGFLGHSRVRRGRLWRYLQLLRRSVDRAEVCGIRTLLPGVLLVWLIRKTCPWLHAPWTETAGVRINRSAVAAGATPPERWSPRFTTRSTPSTAIDSSTALRANTLPWASEIAAIRTNSNYQVLQQPRRRPEPGFSNTP